MKIAILSVFAAGAALLGAAAVGYLLAGKKQRTLSACLPRDWRHWLCCLGVPVSIVGVLLMSLLYYRMPEIQIAKRVALLAVLWPIAVCDFSELRIPNKLILAGGIGWIILTVVELIVSRDTIVASLVNGGVGAAAVIVICVVCMLISKGSLGMGDLKLMLIMALFLGASQIFNAMLVSIFLAFFVALGLLLSKKKKRRDAIPFAPFILSGTFLSFILSGI